MASLSRPRPTTLFVDPHHELVRVINQATFHGIRDGLCDVTLCTLRAVADAEGGAGYEAIVSARIRFDLSMAKALRDGISRQIDLVEASTKTAN